MVFIIVLCINKLLTLNVVRNYHFSCVTIPKNGKELCFNVWRHFFIGKTTGNTLFNKLLRALDNLTFSNI